MRISVIIATIVVSTAAGHAAPKVGRYEPRLGSEQLTDYKGYPSCFEGDRPEADKGRALAIRRWKISNTVWSDGQLVTQGHVWKHVSLLDTGGVMGQDERALDGGVTLMDDLILADDVENGKTSGRFVLITIAVILNAKDQVICGDVVMGFANRVAP